MASWVVVTWENNYREQKTDTPDVCGRQKCREFVDGRSSKYKYKKENTEKYCLRFVHSMNMRPALTQIK